MSNGSKTITFLYDENGQRIRKAVTENGNTVTTEYVVSGKSVTHVIKGTEDLHIFYANGQPSHCKYGNSMYTYVFSLQGDVLGLKDNAGTLVVTYLYDAWGTILSTGGTLANTLGEINPFWYRGYVFDSETGLYYLRSRYYNSTVSRFLNADGSLYTGTNIFGSNVYTYCNNNPVNFTDLSGHSGILAYALIALGTCLLLTGCSNITDIDPLPYESAEEAAKAFSEATYSASLYIRHEYATIIYSRTINGVTTYGYTTPVLGDPHDIRISVSDNDIPFETTKVAVAHTHPNSDEFSGENSDTLEGDILMANTLGLDCYVVGPSLKLRKYSYSSGKVLPDTIDISPAPLSIEDKEILASQFQ